MKNHSATAVAFTTIGSPLLPGWRNGRRSGLKIRRRKACRFKSGPGHHETIAFRQAMDCISGAIANQGGAHRPLANPSGGSAGRTELAEGELNVPAGVADGIGEFHGRAHGGAFVKT